MTREEYLAQTGLKSPEEAASLLGGLRIGLVFSLISQFLLAFAVAAPWSRESIIFMTVTAFLFAVYLAYVGVTILHAAREPIYKIVLSMAFPLYWFWSYQQMTRPLKIATGSLIPPEQIPLSLTSYRPTPFNLALDSTSNRIWAAIGVVLVIVAIGFFKNSLRATTLDLPQKLTAVPYQSLADEFQIQFPETPEYTADPQTSAHKYIAFDANGNLYGTVVFKLPQAGAKDALVDDTFYQDFLNLALDKPGAGTLSGEDTQLQGEPAYRFTYVIPDGSGKLHGHVIKYGTHLYILLMGGDESENDLVQLEDSFARSLRFN
jgi:hypothetical protein